jgi:hypothetical protein
MCLQKFLQENVGFVKGLQILFQRFPVFCEDYTWAGEDKRTVGESMLIVNISFHLSRLSINGVRLI